MVLRCSNEGAGDRFPLIQVRVETVSGMSLDETDTGASDLDLQLASFLSRSLFSSSSASYSSIWPRYLSTSAVTP
jgi:hypothetical protein